MSKKKLITLAVLALVIVSVVALLLVPRADISESDDAVALIRLSGPIQEGSTSLFGPGAITPSLVESRLSSAEDNPSIKAVVLRLNTSGGSVGASQAIADMIEEFPKPIVVSMGDVAASGGYYIAAHADRILAHPGTLTGSIGVIWLTFDPDELLEKLGVELQAITAGKYKDMSVPGGLTPESRRIVERIVETMHEQFISAVAEGRDLPRQRVRALATGQPYTGERARELGLADQIGGVSEAIEAAENLAGIEDARIVEEDRSFLDQFFSGPGASLRGLFEGTDARDEVRMLREVLTDYGGPRYQTR